jgi:hypothetical protein
MIPIRSRLAAALAFLLAAAPLAQEGAKPADPAADTEKTGTDKKSPNGT